jgi:succinate dehydrogenase/fumarate reductase flavoprotein subunit
MGKKREDANISRRNFLKEGAALGLGATTLAGLTAEQAEAQQQRPPRWDHVADVVIAGAGASGIAAAIMARDQGATVIVIDENNDVGGHAMVSGGQIPLGGGNSLQKKFNIEDTPDLVYLDHTNHKNPEMRYSDRDLIRVWADENVPTFDFLVANGVVFNDISPRVVNGGTVGRQAIPVIPSQDLKVTIAGSPGSGLMRPLAASARAKGVTFLLEHKLTNILRQSPASGRVLGITTRFQNRDVNIQARKGVIVATGGHTSNVEIRRIFDPRLTEEYQVAGEPWTRQSGEGELLCMSLGASLWGTAGQNVESGIGPITKTSHVGVRYGYQNLRWLPGSPAFEKAGGSGLTMRNWQDAILVNQVGERFWNEMERSYNFLNAALGTNGNLGKGAKKNGGGPIWAIFDSGAVGRQMWDPKPPNVDPNGWFFSADTLAELAGKIRNPYQTQPMPAANLEATVAKYNSFVDGGKDTDFEKPTPMFKIQTPPFYAAWSTPILHDTLTGLKTNPKCEVIDIHGRVIEGLYCCGECQGGFALHGLARVLVFGRIAGREAAAARS